MRSLRSLAYFLLAAITSFVASAAPKPVPVADYSPQGSASTPFDSSVIIPPVTPDQILSIAPGSSCTSSQFPANECANNVVAAQNLNEGFDKYSLQTLGQKAAMIAYMAFESADFTANINHYPGRPGQGTKCMLMFPGIYKFAASFPENIPTINQNSPGGQLMQTVPYDQYDSMFTPQQQMNIRQLVLGNDKTFHSAMWFTTNDSGCVGIQAAEVLSTNGEQGWNDWNANCLFIGQASADRKAKWCTACKFLAPQGMQMPPDCA